MAGHRRRRPVGIRPHLSGKRQPAAPITATATSSGFWAARVNGGRVYGDWPGLAPAQLYQRRDLAVTTDFRTVLAAILERHMRLADRQLEAVLPAPRRRRKSLARIISG